MIISRLMTLLFAPKQENFMRRGRAIRLVLALSLVALLGAGCNDSSSNPNIDAEGKPITAPVRPGLKPKAADKMKDRMPHL